MLGFAALTVLSLLWMALRVRWRGAFGRKSSALLRSALSESCSVWAAGSSAP